MRRNRHLTPNSATTLAIVSLPLLENGTIYRDMEAGKRESQEGSRLVYVLGQIGKVLELTEIEHRLKALEANTNGSKQLPAPLEALELSAEHSAPRSITRFLDLIVDPDPAIGVVSVVVVDSDDGSRKLREFERAVGENVEDLKRRVRLAMGWNDDQDPR